MPASGHRRRGVVRARGWPLRGLPWRSLGPGLGSACGSFEVLAFGRLEAIGALVVVRRWWLTTGPVRPAGRGGDEPAPPPPTARRSAPAPVDTRGAQAAGRGPRSRPPPRRAP